MSDSLSKDEQLERDMQLAGIAVGTPDIITEKGDLIDLKQSEWEKQAELDAALIRRQERGLGQLLRRSGYRGEIPKGPKFTPPKRKEKGGTRLCQRQLPRRNLTAHIS